MRGCALLPTLKDSDKRYKPELADIFRLYGEQYCLNNSLPPSHHKLMQAIKGKLIFPGNIQQLGTKKGFSRLINRLWKKDWVVYSKKPFKKPEYVLDYLGRYVYRVAISNNRIIAIEDKMVTFWYKKRLKKQRPIKRKMSLKAEEFIRRFLLHVLPDDFMRIRYFGFLSNRYRKERLNQCRGLLGICPDLPKITKKKTCKEMIIQFTGLDISICPHCKKGNMITKVSQ